VPTVGFNIEHFESESDFSHDSRDFDLPQRQHKPSTKGKRIRARSYRLFMFSSMSTSLPFIQLSHLFALQIKVSHSPPMTWLASADIAIYGNITSKHAMAWCL
jgi:hypothetical protein